MADGATTLAVSTGISAKAGWLDFVNVYAPAIGAMASVFFGVAGLIFYVMTWKKSTQADKNTKDLKSLELNFEQHKTETKKEFSTVRDGIDEILNKLND